MQKLELILSIKSVVYIQLYNVLYLVNSNNLQHYYTKLVFRKWKVGWHYMILDTCCGCQSLDSCWLSDVWDQPEIRLADRSWLISVIRHQIDQEIDHDWSRIFSLTIPSSLTLGQFAEGAFSGWGNDLVMDAIMSMGIWYWFSIALFYSHAILNIEVQLILINYVALGSL